MPESQRGSNVASVLLFRFSAFLTPLVTNVSLFIDRATRSCHRSILLILISPFLSFSPVYIFHGPSRLTMAVRQGKRKPQQ